MNNYQICAVLTCFNRRDKTLSCLASLQRCFQLASVAPHAVLVDDGSTDGTADAVRHDFPWVKVIRGDGNLFWNRGMHVAMAEAFQGDYDFYLWVNDDISLREEAVSSALQTWGAVHQQQSEPVIVVGSMSWPDGEQVAYGGVVRPSRLKATTFKIVAPDVLPKDVDTMNGNFVLIPRDVVARIGNLDPAFEHGMGDFDYGLRARMRGCRVVVMPGFAGVCSRNPVGGSFVDRSLPLRIRMKKMLDRRGLPARSWAHFTRRHAGIWWPIFWVWPYIRVMLGR